MTADPIPVIRTVLDGEATQIGTAIKHVGTRPYIRLDPAGGVSQIPAYHDQALVEVHCVHDSNAEARALAYTCRALLDAATGTIGDAVVTKVVTSPPRLRDHPDGKGWASFPVRMFLHPA